MTATHTLTHLDGSTMQCDCPARADHTDRTRDDRGVPADPDLAAIKDRMRNRADAWEKLLRAGYILTRQLISDARNLVDDHDRLARILEWQAAKIREQADTLVDLRRGGSIAPIIIPRVDPPVVVNVPKGEDPVEYGDRVARALSDGSGILYIPSGLEPDKPAPGVDQAARDAFLDNLMALMRKPVGAEADMETQS